MKVLVPLHSLARHLRCENFLHRDPIKVTACSPGVNPFQLDTDSRAEPVQGFLTTE